MSNSGARFNEVCNYLKLNGLWRETAKGKGGKVITKIMERSLEKGRYPGLSAYCDINNQMHGYNLCYDLLLVKGLND
jgi:hypothetical protein